MNFKKIALSALIAAMVPTVALANEVVFVNKTSWNIEQIYFSPANSKKWGEDYLDDEILSKGDSLTLTGVEKGKWDVRLVDEDGDECIVEGVMIKTSDRWVITDKDLLDCQNK
jgi:hypothetical protein